MGAEDEGAWEGMAEEKAGGATSAAASAGARAQGVERAALLLPLFSSHTGPRGEAPAAPTTILPPLPDSS